MNRSILAAIAVIVILSAWMLSGGATATPSTGLETDAAKGGIKAEKKTAMKVVTRHSIATEMERLIRVKGQVEPLRSVVIRAEIDARVEALPVRKGQRIEVGAVLARLSLNDRNARLDEAQAVVKQHQRDVNAARRLHKQKLKPESQLRAEEANLAAARARLEQIRWEIGSTVIKAPFAGVLNERPVERGTFLQSGDIIGTLVDDSVLLLTAQVPQLAVLELKPEQKVTATLINGTELQGLLSFVSTTAAPEIRSYRIEARVPNPDHRPFSGLSATLRLPVGKTLAHKITASILGLAADGRLIVKGVSDRNTVQIHPVKLLRRERDGMWVSGLPPQLHLISLGQEYLSVGDPVRAVPETLVLEREG